MIEDSATRALDAERKAEQTVATFSVHVPPQFFMPKTTASSRRLRTALTGFDPSERRQPREWWIRVRVTEQEHASFHECADKFDTTVSTLIRQLVDHASSRAPGRRAQ